MDFVRKLVGIIKSKLPYSIFVIPYSLFDQLFSV